jgi:hypothetical protein
MEPGSELDRQTSLASLEQADFTATVVVLCESVTLTNLMLQCPTSPDEDSWSARIIVQWNRTINALKDLFFHRSVMHSELERIRSESITFLRNLSRDPSSVPRVGLTIQVYAGSLHDYLAAHHAWHDMDFAACTCCRRRILECIQQSVLYQLEVLGRVDIPQPNLLHGLVGA